MSYLTLQILVYFIIIQALFLGFHFLTQKRNNLISNRILGCLLLSFAISILSYRIILDISSLHFLLKKNLYLLHLMLSFLMYILLFYYIQSIFNRKFNFSLKQSQVHIITFISYFVFGQILVQKLPSLLSNDVQLYIKISAVKVSLYFIYLVLVFTYLKKVYHSFVAFFSVKKNPNLLWLVVLLGSFIFLWLMELFIFLVVMLGVVIVMFKFIVISSIIMPFIFINAILIMALKKPVIFYVNQSMISWSMREDDQHKYLKGFIELMEKETIYKDSELTLNKIAGLLKINPKYLSLILNKHMHSSFPDIVNKYRIETCMQLLKNGIDMTIQQIMYDAGYSSKSAFLKHFKKITGCTPSEYKAKLYKKK